MPRYIVKLSEGDQSWYLEYSSVVDAPITYGMSLQEFKDYYRKEYGDSSMPELEERLTRVENKGTSSHIHSSVEDQLGGNRAGDKETSLSIQQIIDFYCKHPDWKTWEEFHAYDKSPRPSGQEVAGKRR